MPSPSDLPGEIKQKQLLRALKRLGFTINTLGGNGSHVKIIWPKSQKSLTIPYRVEKQTLRYILKEIEACSGVTWENIKSNL